MMAVEVYLGDERAICIRLPFVFIAFNNIPLLLAVIPLTFAFAHHAHVTARDRLAEQVIGAHAYRRVLARQVVTAIRLDFDGKVGQIVKADPYIVGGVRVEFLAIDTDPDAVIAESRIFRNGPIDGDDAETRARNHVTKDGDLFRITNPDEDVLIRECAPRRRKQQRTHVHGLARLVDRLVRRDQRARELVHDDFA